MSKIRQILKVGPMKLVTRYVARKTNVEKNTGLFFKVWRGEAFDHRRKADIAEALVELATIEEQILGYEDPDSVPAHLFADRQEARNAVSSCCVSGRIYADAEGSFDNVFSPVSGEEVKVNIGEVTGQHGPYFRALRISELDVDPEATVDFDVDELIAQGKGEALTDRDNDEGVEEGVEGVEEGDESA